MAEWVKTYTVDPCDVHRLAVEIEEATPSSLKLWRDIKEEAVHGAVRLVGDQATVAVYAGEPSGADITAIDGAVAAHTGPSPLVIAPLLPEADKDRDIRAVDYTGSGLANGSLHKVVTTRFRGEVRQVDYYLDPTLADKVLTVTIWADAALTSPGYSRTANGLAVERWTKREWFREDGSVAAEKVSHKKYDDDPIKQMTEGERRRRNVIQQLTIEVLNMRVATTAADPANPTLQEILDAEADGNAVLNAYDTEIGSYIKTGFIDWRDNTSTPLHTPNLDDDTTAWLDDNVTAYGWTGPTIRDEIQSHLVEIGA